MFSEEHEDAIVRFGRQHRGKWLSETNRHWLSWLVSIKEGVWPDGLLDLVWKWGYVKSKGKPEPFEALVGQQRLRRRSEQILSELQPRLL